MQKILLRVIILLMNKDTGGIRMNEVEFGDYLRKLRKQKKLTMEQIAKATELSQPYISQIENGKKGIPSPEILFKLSKPLEVLHSHLMFKAGYIKDDDVLETEFEKKIRHEEDEKFHQKIKEINFRENNLTNIIFNPNIHLDGKKLSNQDRRRIVDMLNILFSKND